MPTYQTTAIIIGRTNFGEADRIVRMLAAENGKLSAVAKGVRKIASRLGGHLELFGEVSLMLATGRNLDVITSARLIWYPHRLAVDYESLPLAFAIASAVDRLVDQGHPQYKLYEALRQAIHALDEGANRTLLELWFKLQLVDSLGLRPDLSGCSVCGEQSANGSYTFDAAKGGLLCQRHSAASDIFTTNAIKLWRLMLDQPYVTVAAIKDAGPIAAATLPACDKFYEFHLGRSFKPIF